MREADSASPGGFRSLTRDHGVCFSNGAAFITVPFQAFARDLRRRSVLRAAASAKHGRRVFGLISIEGIIFFHL
jgi:hypothetical protein